MTLLLCPTIILIRFIYCVLPENRKLSCLWENRQACAWDSQKVRIMWEEMNEDENFTEVCGVQSPPPHTEVLSEYTQTNGHDLTHSPHSMHIFQKAQNTLQLSDQMSHKGGRAWSYTEDRNTMFCRRRWPLWELVSCLEQTCSSKHPIANIAWRWLSDTWQGRRAVWN